jgi:hypothetical protein
MPEGLHYTLFCNASLIQSLISNRSFCLDELERQTVEILDEDGA